MRDVREAIPDATTSINRPLGRDDASELGDLVEHERASDTTGEVVREIEATSLQEAIERLPERHRYVLVRRYGLDDREPATLAELHEELKVSRERVRQLQRAAEQMLKSRMLTGGARGDLRCLLAAAIGEGGSEADGPLCQQQLNRAVRKFLRSWSQG